LGRSYQTLLLANCMYLDAARQGRERVAAEFCLMQRVTFTQAGRSQVEAADALVERRRASYNKQFPFLSTCHRGLFVDWLVTGNFPYLDTVSEGVPPLPQGEWYLWTEPMVRRTRREQKGWIRLCGLGRVAT